MEDPVYVEPDQLAIGMFVVLELSWLKHPFSFSSFVIQNQEQLATLRGLGLDRVRIDPSRGTASTLDDREPPHSSAPASAPPPVAVAAPPSEGERRAERARALRSSIAHAEQQAARAVRSVRQATSNLRLDPGKSVGQVNGLISSITDSLLGTSEMMIHLLGDKGSGAEVYHHSLNVSVLALILGKALDFDADTLQTLGVAAIFHDVGMAELPSKVQQESEILNPADEALVRQHCELGARLALRSGLSPAVAAAILQHHEHIDGSGYPNRLSGDQIGQVARVIAIVNHYDHLCNPARAPAVVTPYEALSTMFARRRKWFDPAMLARLVHVLGVYPPGSIVQLSNGATALVISVNAARPLQPMVMVHDEAVVKDEAIILDLEQLPELSISKAVRAASLPPAVHEYLSPRKRVAYYFGDQGQGA